MRATPTQKLASGHTHNPLIHISSKVWRVVVRGLLVVIAIVSERGDTEFESYLGCVYQAKKYYES